MSSILPHNVKVLKTTLVAYAAEDTFGTLILGDGQSTARITVKSESCGTQWSSLGGTMRKRGSSGRLRLDCSYTMLQICILRCTPWEARDSVFR